MSLADELLADLEENDQDDLAEAMDAGGVKEEKPDIKDIPMEQDTTQITSSKLKVTVQRSGRAADIIGPVEADPEYQLIVEANNIAQDVDNEIVTVHKFVRDKYQKRFPELESLVVSPLEYVKTVKELGNDLDQAKNNEILQQFLTQATIMVVSVTASTTQGTLLTQFEKEQIDEACDMAMELNNFKLRIYEYVESRMAL
ncbi:hypothetical protein NQ317_005745 [Molorchus minor]|uniref:NOSIC domain-containing protein n=1 Tax=Molorchus minor TaxID=1323400 RepID=A0ABQ9JM61_9CUCU|nr:hypothetical protein NQ317_005745 [Molorchus minor]